MIRLQHNSHTQVSGNIAEEDQKDCKSQRNRKCANKCTALDSELQATKECWQWEKIVIPREEPSQLAIQDQVVSPLGSLFKNESPLLTGYIQ